MLQLIVHKLGYDMQANAANKLMLSYALLVVMH